jgi:hypothetical protein
MSKMPHGKKNASLSLTEVVLEKIEDAMERHVRIDGTRPVRKSDYVEDVLRRDMIAKGVLVLPTINVGKAAKKKTASKKAPARKKTSTRKRP